jgi:hypothetical protein
MLVRMSDSRRAKDREGVVVLEQPIGLEPQDGSLDLEGLVWNSLVQTIGLPSFHSETTLVTGMYCMIVSGFTSASQTFARGTLIVTDACPTKVSAI